MTVFEFICAQAPRTTQGLLIGLWYATFSIRYLVGLVDAFLVEKELLANFRRSEGVSDPGVSGAVLMCVQTLPLPRARRDSQCAGNDRGHSREVVRPGGGVHARAQSNSIKTD